MPSAAISIQQGISTIPLIWLAATKSARRAARDNEARQQTSFDSARTRRHRQIATATRIRKGVEEEGEGPAVRFLVEGGSLSRDALDELPVGHCVVVVDDAHRYVGLDLLFAYAVQRVDVTLVLAPRFTDCLRFDAEINATEEAELY